MNSSITQNVFQCSFDFPELHVVQPSLQRKCCTKCKETKTLDQFYKDRSGKDGYSPCCKQCKKAQLLERSLRNEDARELGLVEILSQKHCTQCGRLLPIEHFSKNRRRKDGRHSACRACISARRQEQVTPEKRRIWHLRQDFGITVEQYNQMLEAQGGVCACCKQPETHTRPCADGVQISPLSIDHNHRTGEIRALLCHHCNAAYGHLREDEARILALLEYHRQHQKP
jgi:recombination endonuclease VII